MLLLKYHEYKFETINLFQKQIVGCSSGKVCRAKFKCHCRLWKFSLTEIAILFFRNSMKRSLKNASAINHRITSHNSWNFCQPFMLHTIQLFNHVTNLFRIYQISSEEKIEPGMLKDTFISQLWLHIGIYSGTSHIDLCIQGHGTKS